MTYSEKITEAANIIDTQCGKAEIGLILGSGLSESVSLDREKTLPFSSIPNFPISTVSGHKNELVGGTLFDKKICMMRGRFHFYEGYTPKDLIMPIYIMKMLGVKILIVTNAAGGVNETFVPGNLMLIRDHINFVGVNPLVGENMDAFGTRFPDMTQAYDAQLGDLAHCIAAEHHLDLKDGTYLWLSGPSYETPAEIRMTRLLGADAVGMSTVPEVIAARHCGLRVLGLSCITNMAAGISQKPLQHEEVLATGQKSLAQFSLLIREIIHHL